MTLANRVREHESTLQQVHQTLQSLIGQGLLPHNPADAYVAPFVSSAHLPADAGMRAPFSQEIFGQNEPVEYYIPPPNAAVGPSSNSDSTGPSESVDDAARTLEDIAFSRSSNGRNQPLDESAMFLGASVEIPRNATHPYDARLSSLADFESLPIPLTARSLVKTAVRLRLLQF